MRQKVCSRCKECKWESEFGVKNQNKDGLHCWCKECVRAYNRGFKRARPDYYRTYHISTKYGLSKEEYSDILELQRGLCANPECDNPATDVDHDHSCCPGKTTCGKCIRGILCHWCNLTEGLMGSDPVKLEGLAQYIRVNRDNLPLEENAVNI